MTHRDSNQGACTNSCRWRYSAKPAMATPEGDIVARDGDATNVMEGSVQQFNPLEVIQGEQAYMLLEEENRPGELMPALEDEHGTYIMNSKDLRAVQHVKQLIDIGVDSLKIEGRTKSHFYVARTAQVYRRAINDAKQQKAFDWQLMDDLEGLANRGYTEGFYRRHLPKEYQNYEQNSSLSGTQQFVGEVKSIDKETATIVVKNKFGVGDTLQVITPSGDTKFTLQDMWSEKGKALDVAPGDGWVVKIPLPDIELDAFSLFKRCQ